jgi:hypothetical protein
LTEKITEGGEKLIIDFVNNFYGLKPIGQSPHDYIDYMKTFIQQKGWIKILMTNP